MASMRRMNTDERIIATAVRLFNRDGLARVSLRQIAAEVGISHSNLAYHFRDKAMILEAIYLRMKAEMDDAVYPGKDVSLRHYNRLIKRISAFQLKYRFFYMDLLEVARSYPDTARRYRETIAERFAQYDRLIADFIGKGLVKAEPEPGFYRSLFHALWVMSTFWLQHRRILGEHHPVIATGSDIKHVWEILLPHLTDAGLREFQQIQREQPCDDAVRPIQRHYLRKVV
jgi:AcrR family transcriptional regulator